MSMLKVAALAAALAGGMTVAAEAQPYGYGGYGHVQPRHYGAPPVYVPPHIARKQAQLQERFVEKYGYVQPHRPQYRPYAPYGRNLYRHHPRAWGRHGW